MSAPSGVEWECSHCGQPLSLSDWLWRTPEGKAFCGKIDLPTGATPRLHAPKSSWIHPALREAR